MMARKRETVSRPFGLDADRDAAFVRALRAKGADVLPIEFTSLLTESRSQVHTLVNPTDEACQREGAEIQLHAKTVTG